MLCFQILVYNFIMSVLWLYVREGVFDSEVAHRKSRLPLIVGQMPKLVISLTDKNKTAWSSSLGTEISLENPVHTANI